MLVFAWSLGSSLSKLVFVSELSSKMTSGGYTVAAADSFLASKLLFIQAKVPVDPELLWRTTDGRNTLRMIQQSSRPQSCVAGVKL